MISMFSLSLMAGLASLPANIQTSMDKAFETGDAFVIKAVVQQALKENPEKVQDIKAYAYKSLNKPKEEEKPTPKLEKTPPKAKNIAQNTGFWDSGWDGSIEGGILIRSGNSENENVNGALKVTKTTGDWEHKFAAAAANTSSNEVRSAEQYKAGLQSRNNLSDVDYVFGEVEWIKDRFSGFEFRLSETLGYGYKFYSDDDFKLSAEGSLGLQQSQETGEDTENNFIQRLSADLEYKFNDNLYFTQHLSTEHAGGVFFSLSQSAIKSKISESLAFKFGVELEHISEVPAGTEKLDTKTTANVVYDF